VDSAKIVAEILGVVARKREEGVYDDARVARAEKNNLLNLQDDESFMHQYLACLRQISQVDINDFEIVEKRGGLVGKMLAAFKKFIWKLLKFYTYRLWSQQNQVNMLLLSGLETLDRHYRREIDQLKARIDKLEGASR